MATSTSTSMQKQKSSSLKTNVSALERILMVTAGGYLLYAGLQRNKNAGKIGLGGSMVLRGVSGYCPVYDAVDHLKNDKASNVNIRINSVIKKPVSEVYAFWRDFENLPKFMNHLDSVKSLTHTTSEWTAKGPMGIGKISWKAEIIKDEKEKMLSWSSLPDSTIKNAGKVVFKPKGNATEIDVTISYHAPMGVAGESAAKLLNPYFSKLVKDDILNFKEYLESL